MRSIFLLLAVSLVVPLPAAATPAREPAGARRFIEYVYAGYPRHKPWPEAEYRGLFAPELRTLIVRNDNFSPDDVGPLDGDPICRCQDDSGFRHELVRITGSSSRAVAVVRNIFGPPAPHREDIVTYRLVRISGKWRISDISTADEPSMKAWLSKALDAQR
jgi:hypothetical protein